MMKETPRCRKLGILVDVDRARGGAGLGLQILRRFSIGVS